jgi:hypothetical protein
MPRDGCCSCECCSHVALSVHLQVGVQLLLLYMLYFFTGMLLRESVLKVREPPDML